MGDGGSYSLAFTQLLLAALADGQQAGVVTARRGIPAGIINTTPITSAAIPAKIREGPGE